LLPPFTQAMPALF